MFNNLKSIGYHTTFFAYNSGYSALKMGISAIHLGMTAGYSIAACAYTIKYLTKMAYYSAKDIPPVGGALFEYSYAAASSATTGKNQPWTKLENSYSEAIQIARTDFSKTTSTFSKEINSIKQPLLTNLKATYANGAQSVTFAVTALGHALEVGHNILYIGSEALGASSAALKITSNLILGENRTASQPVQTPAAVNHSRNPSRLFTPSPVEKMPVVKCLTPSLK